MSDADEAAEAVEDIQADAEAALADESVAGGIIQAGALRQYLKTINGLVAECRIHIGDHGFRVSAI